jgi:hypothetical protein
LLKLKTQLEILLKEKLRPDTFTEDCTRVKDFSRESAASLNADATSAEGVQGFSDKIEFSKYPSATEVLFQPPCLFTQVISVPLSANKVAE